MNDLILAPDAVQVAIALLVGLLVIVTAAYALAPVHRCDAPDCHAKQRKDADWCYWHHRPKSHCRGRHWLR